MATQTETYKLNKPARTDKIGIDLLNENMDIIEEELKKRPLNSDVAGAAFYDLDLSSWVTVEFAGYNLDSNTMATATNDSNLPGGAAAFLAAVASGSLPRIKLKDNNGAEFCVVLDVCETSTDGAKNVTNCTGTMADAVYDVIDSFRLKIEETSEEYSVTFYASRKVNGVGTVKTVNGVTPDDDGNVEISIAAEEPGTTKLDFSNWSNGSFTEHLDNGTAEVYNVARDGTGAITSIGGITIVGVG